MLKNYFKNLGLAKNLLLEISYRKYYKDENKQATAEREKYNCRMTNMRMM